MHEKDIESGRMIFARSSRLRGLFYFVALGMMVGLLTTVQLRGIRNGPSRGIDDGLTVPPASSVNPIGSRNGTVESEEEKNERKFEFICRDREESMSFSLFLVSNLIYPKSESLGAHLQSL